MTESTELKYHRIHIVINPAAGRDLPILGPLNSVLQKVGADWDVSVTKQAGDAYRQARAAVAAGVDVVAAYGGDGTVMEVASALVGSGVPLAILPGGTANVMSLELGIPPALVDACALIYSDQHTLRPVDMGQIGEKYFLLRTGAGVEAEMVINADRETKNRFGSLAYLLSALQALTEPPVVHYSLNLDGLQVETQGITCVITNAGNVGLPGLSLAPTINISDGLLDVLIIPRADLGTLVSVGANALIGAENARTLQHWQAQEITVTTDPPQAVQVDGEAYGQTPIHLKVVPQAIHVIVPRPALEVAPAG